MSDPNALDASPLWTTEQKVRFAVAMEVMRSGVTAPKEVIETAAPIADFILGTLPSPPTASLSSSVDCEIVQMVPGEPIELPPDWKISDKQPGFIPDDPREEE